MKKYLPFLVVALLLLSACTQATPEAPPPVEPTAAVEAPPAAVPPAVEPEKTSLRITQPLPLFIDPAVGSDYVSSTSLANLYDSLIFPTAGGGTEPWLAESWEASANGLTYTFQLRQGVTFHDGSELLASDVVYSHNRLQTIGEGYAYLVSGVAEVTAPDDYTVVFTLGQPSGLFVPSLVRLYVVNEDLVRTNTNPEGPYGENGDYGKDWLLTHDAGSGPYTVIEFPLEEFALMEKFEDWWAKDQFNAYAPDQVKLILTTEGATVRTLMETGALEISDQWQPVEAFNSLDGIEGVDITAFSTMSSFYYMMNNRLAPLDDIHCRKAIAWAFDYEGAIALEWPGTQQMVGPVPAVLGGHDPTVFTY
ncbi:MAG: ABC transporter substrate-binding protein, partial [Chloroflexota bacterium]